jgi:hypothetical protein
MPRSSASKATRTGSRTRTSAPRHRPRAPKSRDRSPRGDPAEAVRTPHNARLAGLTHRNRPDPAPTARSRADPDDAQGPHAVRAGVLARRASAYALRSSLRSSLRAQALIPTRPVLPSPRWSTFQPALTPGTSSSRDTSLPLCSEPAGRPASRCGELPRHPPGSQAALHREAGATHWRSSSSTAATRPEPSSAIARRGMHRSGRRRRRASACSSAASADRSRTTAPSRRQSSRRQRRSHCSDCSEAAAASRLVDLDQGDTPRGGGGHAVSVWCYRTAARERRPLRRAERLSSS